MKLTCHFESLPKIFFGHNERMTNAEGNCHFDELARRNLLFKVRFPLLRRANDRVVEQGAYFRTGHIPLENGTDLIVWIQFESDEQVKIQLHK